MNDKLDNKYRIIITILAAILVVISLIAFKFNNKDEVKENIDAIKFKEEYESLNGKIAYENYKYPELNILKNNPFKYLTEEEAVDFVKNGTGIIYMGFKDCPWCRNAVNVLQHLTGDVYYLDLTNMRDSYDFLNGKLTKTKEGTKSYYELLKLLDGILDEYNVEDDNKNSISTGEKRIYVPLVIGFQKGKIVDYHLDTVELKEGQTAFDILDKDQQENLKKIYDEIKTKVYDDTCGLKPSEGC